MFELKYFNYIYMCNCVKSHMKSKLIFVTVLLLIHIKTNCWMRNNQKRIVSTYYQGSAPVKTFFMYILIYKLNFNRHTIIFMNIFGNT
jgi:hypothetical protein